VCTSSIIIHHRSSSVIIHHPSSYISIIIHHPLSSSIGDRPQFGTGVQNIGLLLLLLGRLLLLLLGRLLLPHGPLVLFSSFHSRTDMHNSVHLCTTVHNWHASVHAQGAQSCTTVQNCTHLSTAVLNWARLRTLVFVKCSSTLFRPPAPPKTESPQPFAASTLPPRLMPNKEDPANRRNNVLISLLFYYSTSNSTKQNWMKKQGHLVSNSGRKKKQSLA
jgi:hypothetical protein